MAIILTRLGGTNDLAYSDRDILRALAQSVARSIAEPIASLTDSSGGVASTTRTLTASSALTDVAASGSNLATKASADAALLTVKDALATCFTKANAVATALGLPTVTYNGGGTDGAGTIAAITVASTAGTTGIPAANANIMLTAVRNAIYNLAVLVNKLCAAVGAKRLKVTSYKGVGNWQATIAAIAALTGANAAPAVSKAALDVELAKMQVNIATIAARINDVVTLKVPLVLAQ